MAEEFPECHFLGVDITQLPSTTILPSNCSFKLLNVLDGLYTKNLIHNYVYSLLIKIGIPKPDNWFDYVHQCFLAIAIPKDEWQNHINECVRICAPRGWVEFVETTGILFDGSTNIQQFNTWLIQGLATRGIDMIMTDRLDVLMRKAGLVNITTQSYILPFGDWGKQVGRLFAEDYRLAMESLEQLFIDALCIPREQFKATLALVLEEFKYARVYAKLYVHLSQKAVI
jgi:hypothetical protein